MVGTAEAFTGDSLAGEALGEPANARALCRKGVLAAAANPVGEYAWAVAKLAGTGEVASAFTAGEAAEPPPDRTGTGACPRRVAPWVEALCRTAAANFEACRAAGPGAAALTSARKSQRFSAKAPSLNCSSPGMEPKETCLVLGLPSLAGCM